jgi:hypothetical protein
MTLQAKVMVAIAAVLVIGIVGPLLAMKVGGGSGGIHLHSISP